MVSAMIYTMTAMFAMALSQETTSTATAPILSVLKVYDAMPTYHAASALGADATATTVMIDCESACGFWPSAVVTQGPSTFAADFYIDSEEMKWNCTFENGSGPATCEVQNVPSGYWSFPWLASDATAHTLPDPRTVVLPELTYYPVSITAGPLTAMTQATSINYTVTAINSPSGFLQGSADTTSTVEAVNNPDASGATVIPTQSSSANQTQTRAGGPVSSREAGGADRKAVGIVGSIGGILLGLIAYL